MLFNPHKRAREAFGGQNDQIQQISEQNETNAPRNGPGFTNNPTELPAADRHSEMFGEQLGRLRQIGIEFWRAPYIADTSPVEGLQEPLFEHQASGLARLISIMDKLGGCMVADEMGLGKTLLVIAFLLHQKNNGVSKPALIIMPKPLIGQWMEQLNRFVTPGRLVVKTYCFLNAPEDCKNFPIWQLAQCDVIITTYDTVQIEFSENERFKSNFRARQFPHVAKDSEFNHEVDTNVVLPRPETKLFSIEYSVCILDEGQTIWDSQSPTTEAVCEIKSDLRLLVTGPQYYTAFEDLCSVFQFLRIPPWTRAVDFEAFFCRDRQTDRVSNRSPTRKTKRDDLCKIMLRAFLVHRPKCPDITPVTTRTIATLVSLDDKIPIKFSDDEQGQKGAWPPLTEQDTQNRVKGSGTEELPQMPFMVSTLQHRVRARMAAAHYAVPRFYQIPYQAEVALQLHPCDTSTGTTKLESEKGKQPDLQVPRDLPHSDAEILRMCFDSMVEEIESKRFTLSARQVRWMEEMSAADSWKSTKMVEVARIVEKRLKEDSGKIIFFERYYAIQMIIGEMCRQNGWQFVHCCSRVGSDEDRYHALAQFRQNPDVRIMITTPRLSEIGLNLHMAKTVIFVSSAYTLDLVEQCTNRVARFPNPGPVDVYLITARKSIDEHIYEETRRLVELQSEDCLEEDFFPFEFGHLSTLDVEY